MTDEPPVILISGASSGIGAASAELFARQGYRVVLAARRMDRLEAVAETIRAVGGQALPVATDVSRLDDLQNLVDMALGEFGQVDILLNNAGFGRLNWLEKLDPQEDIARQIQVNLLGCINLTRLLLPHLIERRSGHIINMASLAGWVATPTYTIYAASKFGMRGFTDALRREVRVWGIRVTGIYPGGVDTEFRHHTGLKRRTGVTTPGWLRLSADDVARSVLSAVKRPRRAVIIPAMMRPVVWLNELFPGLADLTIEQRFVRKEREHFS